MSLRFEVKGMLAALATLGMFSVGHAMDRESYKLYEMQYELSEFQAMSQLDQGKQDPRGLAIVSGHSPPAARDATQEECASNLASLAIRARVDRRLANAYGDHYPFLMTRAKQYEALLSGWQRGCAGRSMQP